VFVAIVDPDDPRVADYRQLNDGPFRRGLEAPKPFSPGIFVAEGWLVLERALAARCDLRSILVAEQRQDRLDEMLATIRGVTPEVLVASPETIEQIVGFDLHRGVVAIGQRGRALDLGTLARRAKRVLVVEGVSDTENLGALFRNAAAFGANAVMVDSTSADPWSRRVIRTSVGHSLSVPWCRGSISAIVRALEGHRLVALTPQGELDLGKVEHIEGVAVGIVVGAEGPGLTSDTLDACAARVRIEMSPGVDSLNVAAAAAIAMWQLFDRPPHSTR